MRTGAPVSVRLVFHPISVSGETSYNNYQPVLLAGDDAQRVLDKMADSTGVTRPPTKRGRGRRRRRFLSEAHKQPAPLRCRENS